MSIEFLNGIGKNIYTQANPIPKIEKVSKEFQNKVLQQYIAIEKEQELLSSDVLMSYASPRTKELVNIYKSKKYSKNHLVYILKGLDVDGIAFEQEIDASKVNLEKCNYNELMVLNLEIGYNSFKDYLHAVVVQEKSGVATYFDEANFLIAIKEVMEDQKTWENWSAYVAYDRWIQKLMMYISKNKEKF